MTKKLLLIAAIGLGLGLSLASSAVSCEMHKTHATIAAATAAPPAKVEPVILPQSKVTEEAAMTVAPETVTYPRAMGGCQRQRQTTVYLTQ